MSRLFPFVISVIVLIGCVRIVATYRVFCETFDEPAHIAAGVEWIGDGRYTADREHPPLARVAAAIGLYAAGSHYKPAENVVAAGNQILYGRGSYLHNLSLARAGILPFFILASLIVALWTRRLWGDGAAILATALFTNEPNVLAHAGLATTDMAGAAMTAACAYAFWRWWDSLHRPDPSPSSRLRMTGVLGVVGGLTLLSKYSVLLFVPVAIIAVAISEIIAHRRPTRPLRAAAFLGIAALIAIVVVWAGFRFSFEPFFDGVRAVRNHASTGHESSINGEFRQFGWWYYFPFAIGIKSTIGFLLLLAAGAVATIRGGVTRIAPLLAALLMVFAVLPSTINIGVRHILPAYPFFAIVAGSALTLVTTIERRWMFAAAACAAFLPSIIAHPDYLPYFNALAGKDPEEIFSDSNIDWGQDLLRVAPEMRRRNIKSLGLVYAGNANPFFHGIPGIMPVDPFAYTPGWIGISEMIYRGPKPEYRWLHLFKPIGRIGRTIRLYHLPPSDEFIGRRTPLLLPVWFRGTFHGWTCELNVRGDSGRTIASLLRELPDSPDGAVVLVGPSAAIAPLDLSLHSGAAKLDLPVVRDFLHDAVHFTNVPGAQKARVTIRIYDLTGQARTATVRLTANGRTIEHALPLTRQATPLASITASLENAFPGRPDGATISVDPPSNSYWTFLTITDSSTGSTQAVLP